MSDNILTRTIANVTYDFAMRGEDTQVLCLRTVGEIWRDAFQYFSVITDGSARYDDTLLNIMMELAEQEDSASIYALETSGDVAYNEAYRGLDSDPRDDYAMQAYDSQDMAERMANADYEHGQS